MKIGIVGRGGREEALLESLYRSEYATDISFFNAGESFGRMAQKALGRGINLMIVGPEQPLCDGIVDFFYERAPSIKVFGPSKAAARLEGSKVYCKWLCVKYGIPTASYQVAENTREARYLSCQAFLSYSELVIKADGLRSGKGVHMPQSPGEAWGIVKPMIRESIRKGEKGVIFEQKLEGREVSVMALCDGKNAMLLEPARDYKRLAADSDVMTGGMGAYSPVPDVTPDILRTINERIVRPLVKAMAAEGTPYHGVMYAGVMLTGTGPKLLEVNCRFGDPEAQVVLPRLASDIVPYLVACTQHGGLAALRLPKWKKEAAVAVCLASPRYPAEGHRLRTMVGLGKTLWHARERVYADIMRLPDRLDYTIRYDIAAGV